MSLTSELARKDGPVHLFMRQNFPNLSAVRPHWREALRDATTIAPDSFEFPWARVGGAIDYRIRFAFETPRFDDLVAFKGARYMLAHLVSDQNRWIDRIQAFADELAIADGDRLCRMCFILALLDEPYRTGDLPDELAQATDLLELVEAVPDEWIADIHRLFDRFVETQRPLLDGPAVCNPTFAGSRLIGGADADLIVDGCLIELKTQKRPSASWQTLYQLVGYVLLDFTDEFQIDAVGVYLTRQGVLVRWPLDTYLSGLHGGPVDLGRARAAFEELLVRAQP